jgi:hypothetical protein
MKDKIMDKDANKVYKEVLSILKHEPDLWSNIDS